MYMPRLIAHSHSERVAALKAQHDALLVGAETALNLAETLNRNGDPIACGEVIAEARALLDRANRLLPVA